MKAFGVFGYHLLDFFIQIAKGSARWKPTALKLALNATLRIFPQINDKLVGHAAFHIEQQNVVVWEILTVYGLYGFEHTSLQEPAQLTAINRIPREAVYLPTQDAARLAVFDALHDLLKNGAVVRLLGRLRLGIDFLDVQVQSGSKLFEPIYLVVNGLYLSVFAFGGLAGIEEVFNFLLL